MHYVEIGRVTKSGEPQSYKVEKTTTYKNNSQHKKTNYCISQVNKQDKTTNMSQLKIKNTNECKPRLKQKYHSDK